MYSKNKKTYARITCCWWLYTTLHHPPTCKGLSATTRNLTENKTCCALYGRKKTWMCVGPMVELIDTTTCITVCRVLQIVMTRITGALTVSRQSLITAETNTISASPSMTETKKYTTLYMLQSQIAATRPSSYREYP